jgi:large subunit ribosomal protein L3
MPGQMGNKVVTIPSLIVMKIDHALNCIYVKGSVPGLKSNIVRLRDALFYPFDRRNPPPYPTFFPDPSVPLPREVKAPTLGKDPLFINLEQPQK